MSFSTATYNARLWVSRGDRLVGACNAGALRPYVFPLYSPKGALVIQESPVDHPHHQGVWAGLEIDGHDLWNAGSFDKPRHRQELVGGLPGLTPVVTDTSVAVNYLSRWSTVDGTHMLDEQRTITFRATADWSAVDFVSTFKAPGRAVTLGKTKESGLGLRVPPHWETRFGGRIRNSEGAEGEAECFDKSARWVSIQGRVHGDSHAGVIMVPTSAPTPWFTRNYGCHVYNPARHTEIPLGVDDALTWSMRVIAYDGDLDIAAIDRIVAAAE